MEGTDMDREWKDVVRVLAVLMAVVGALIAAVLLIVKYKEEISDFLAEVRMKCPCAHREEDDYADDELNCICNLDDAEN